MDGKKTRVTKARQPKKAVLKRGGKVHKRPVRIKEDEIDDVLVKETVAWIGATLAETIHRGMYEVGSHIFETFFDGDPEKVSSREAGKHASFRSLAEQCKKELSVSKTWLYSAVKLAMMDRVLPAGAKEYRSLSPSKQIALIPVQEPKDVVKLAKVAAKEDLSVRRLKELVRAELARKGKDPRGRKPKPVLIKALDRSYKELSEKHLANMLKNGEPIELSNGDRDTAIQKIDEHFSMLKKLRANLEKHVV